MKKNKSVYGIDFGTTNSTITAIDNSKEPRTLKIDLKAINQEVVRSVIYVNHKHEFMFGQKAIENYNSDIAQGKVAKKKKIFTGKYYKVARSSLVAGFKEDEIVPEIIEIEEGEGGRLFQSLKSILGLNFISKFSVFQREYEVEELISIFLKEIKKLADENLNENVTSVVLGRPVEFVGKNNQIAVERLKNAAQKAGFKEIIFEYEPVGAAYDYGLNINKNQIAMMFDFGGGTLDLTIMKFPEKKVIINSGIPLGGDYINSQIFTERIGKYFGQNTTYGDLSLPVPSSIYQSLKNWYSISLLKTENFAETLEKLKFNNSDPQTIDALQSLIWNNLGFKLYEEIDNTKKGLSSNKEQVLKFVENLINIYEKITIDEFNIIIKNDLEDIENLINHTLSQAKLQLTDIDFVSTTGGSSLIPAIKNLLQNKFGEEKMKHTDAFTSVSKGLALRAYEEFLE